MIAVTEFRGALREVSARRWIVTTHLDDTDTEFLVATPVARFHCGFALSTVGQTIVLALLDGSGVDRLDNPADLRRVLSAHLHTA